jgi:hypothetical protein
VKKKRKLKKVGLPVAKGPVEKVCRNCLCYDRQKEQCKVVVFINGHRFNMPVFPDDRCHLDELGIEVKEVRWRVVDESGQPTTGNGRVQIEYPEDDFFVSNPAKYIKPQPEKPPLPPSEPLDEG